MQVVPHSWLCTHFSNNPRTSSSNIKSILANRLWKRANKKTVTKRLNIQLRHRQTSYEIKTTLTILKFSMRRNDPMIQFSINFTLQRLGYWNILRTSRTHGENWNSKPTNKRWMLTASTLASMSAWKLLTSTNVTSSMPSSFHFRLPVS